MQNLKTRRPPERRTNKEHQKTNKELRKMVSFSCQDLPELFHPFSKRFRAISQRMSKSIQLTDVAFSTVARENFCGDSRPPEPRKQRCSKHFKHLGILDLKNKLTYINTLLESCLCRKWRPFHNTQDPYVLFKSQRVTIGRREDFRRRTRTPTFAGETPRRKKTLKIEETFCIEKGLAQDHELHEQPSARSFCMNLKSLDSSFQKED